MVFKNLEARYNENVDKLYAGATTKFDNGKATTNSNVDPLITRKPGDGYWSAVESRSTPVSSTINDVKRLTLFTTSPRGIRFLAKQQLLQTGNTFEASRIINPMFVVSNGVPFLHVKRALDLPITKGTIARSLVGDNRVTSQVFGSGAQRKDVDSLRKIGQLQNETYNRAINRKDLIGGTLKKIPVIGQTASAVRAKRSVGDGIYEYTESRPELATSRELQAAGRALSAVGSAFGSSLLSFTGGVMSTMDMGYIVSKHRADNTRFQKGQTTFFRPVHGPSTVSANYETYLQETNLKSSWTHGFIKRRSFVPLPGQRENGDDPSTTPTERLTLGIPDKDKLKSLYQTKFTYEDGSTASQNNQLSITYGKIGRIDWFEDNNEDLPSFLRYFSSDQESISQDTELESTNGFNARDLALEARRARRKISYIKDPSNEKAKADLFESRKLQLPYKHINVDFQDPIMVSFAMGNDDPVYFRAFIQDLKQSATPEYKSYQYIGRMERFVNYVGVQREVSFKLGLIAFSKNEIDGLWRRINYLTGLVFPYGFNRGIFQPNIVRLSIGNVYLDQPGYISSLNTNFNELVDSWNIDFNKQVPISAVMDINFVLIEKSSKIAESPFYAIADKLDGFSNTIGERPFATIDPPLQNLPVLTTTVEQRSTGPETNIATPGLGTVRPNTRPATLTTSATPINPVTPIRPPTIPGAQ